MTAGVTLTVGVRLRHNALAAAQAAGKALREPVYDHLLHRQKVLHEEPQLSDRPACSGVLVSPDLSERP